MGAGYLVSCKIDDILVFENERIKKETNLIKELKEVSSRLNEIENKLNNTEINLSNIKIDLINKENQLNNKRWWNSKIGYVAGMTIIVGFVIKNVLRIKFL